MLLTLAFGFLIWIFIAGAIYAALAFSGIAIGGLAIAAIFFLIYLMIVAALSVFRKRP